MESTDVMLTTALMALRGLHHSLLTPPSSPPQASTSKTITTTPSPSEQRLLDQVVVVEQLITQIGEWKTTTQEHEIDAHAPTTSPQPGMSSAVQTLIHRKLGEVVESLRVVQRDRSRGTTTTTSSSSSPRSSSLGSSSYASMRFTSADAMLATVEEHGAAAQRSSSQRLEELKCLLRIAYPAALQAPRPRPPPSTHNNNSTTTTADADGGGAAAPATRRSSSSSSTHTARGASTHAGSSSPPPAAATTSMRPPRLEASLTEPSIPNTYVDDDGDGDDDDDDQRRFAAMDTAPFLAQRSRSRSHSHAPQQQQQQQVHPVSSTPSSSSSSAPPQKANPPPPLPSSRVVRCTRHIPRGTSWPSLIADAQDDVKHIIAEDIVDLLNYGAASPSFSADDVQQLRLELSPAGRLSIHAALVFSQHTKKNHDDDAIVEAAVDADEVVLRVQLCSFPRLMQLYDTFEEQQQQQQQQRTSTSVMEEMEMERDATTSVGGTSRRGASSERVQRFSSARGAAITAARNTNTNDVAHSSPASTSSPSASTHATRGAAVHHLILPDRTSLDPPSSESEEEGASMIEHDDDGSPQHHQQQILSRCTSGSATSEVSLRTPHILQAVAPVEEMSTVHLPPTTSCASAAITTPPQRAVPADVLLMHVEDRSPLPSSAAPAPFSRDERSASSSILEEPRRDAPQPTTSSSSTATTPSHTPSPQKKKTMNNNNNNNNNMKNVVPVPRTRNNSGAERNVFNLRPSSCTERLTHRHRGSTSTAPHQTTHEDVVVPPPPPCIKPSMRRSSSADVVAGDGVGAEERAPPTTASVSPSAAEKRVRFDPSLPPETSSTTPPRFMMKMSSGRLPPPTSLNGRWALRGRSTSPQAVGPSPRGSAIAAHRGGGGGVASSPRTTPSPRHASTAPPPPTTTTAISNKRSSTPSASPRSPSAMPLSHNTNVVQPGSRPRSSSTPTTTKRSAVPATTTTTPPPTTTATSSSPSVSGIWKKQLDRQQQQQRELEKTGGAISPTSPRKLMHFTSLGLTLQAHSTVVARAEGPAAEAGIGPRDVLRTIDGHTITSPEDLTAYLERSSNNSTSSSSVAFITIASFVRHGTILGCRVRLPHSSTK